MIGTLIVSVGGGPIGIVTGADVPPPGAGFETVTSPLPSTGTSAAESVAVSVVLLIVLVVFDEPFHSTIDSALNPVPVTISVAPTPARRIVGDTDEMTGAGLVIGVSVASARSARTRGLVTPGPNRSPYRSSVIDRPVVCSA